MTKTLKVINPFFVMEVGDTFERTEDGKYVSSYSSTYSSADSDNNCADSTYNSTYEISENYANTLVQEGFLEEVKPESDYVNVFDEINKLIDVYATDLKNMSQEMLDAPECLKVEKRTVLENLIKTLDHLNSLKK